MDQLAIPCGGVLFIWLVGMWLSRRRPPRRPSRVWTRTEEYD